MALAEVEAVARAAYAAQNGKAERPYAEPPKAVAEGVRARCASPPRPPSGSPASAPPCGSTLVVPLRR